MDERSIRVAFILASATLAGAFGAIAYGVGHMNGTSGLSAWRWLFILEGIPSCLSPVFVWFFLPDYPERALWLSETEKHLAVDARVGGARQRACDGLLHAVGPVLVLQRLLARWAAGPQGGADLARELRRRAGRRRRVVHQPPQHLGHQARDLQLAPRLAPLRSAGGGTLKQCDDIDGAADGIISLPEQCSIDYDLLVCSSPKASMSARLSNPQIQTLKNVYSDYDSTTGEFLYPGLKPGVEKQMYALLNYSTSRPYGIGYSKYFIFDDLNDTAVALAARLNPGGATTADYNLSEFRDRGGKMIMYHGMADGLVPLKGSTLYYDQVAQTTGGGNTTATRGFFRYFMLPGMQHCGQTTTDAPWAFGGEFQAAMLRNDTWSVPGVEDATHDMLLAGDITATPTVNTSAEHHGMTIDRGRTATGAMDHGMYAKHNASQPGLEVMPEPELPQVVEGPVVAIGEKAYDGTAHSPAHSPPPQQHHQYAAPYAQAPNAYPNDGTYPPPSAYAQQNYQQPSYPQEYQQQPYQPSYPQSTHTGTHPRGWSASQDGTYMSGPPPPPPLEGPPARRILGLRIKTFWLVFGPMLVLLVIGLAVGLGVGLSTGQHNDSDDSDSDSDSPAPASPLTCPSANSTTYDTGSGSSFLVLCNIDYNSGGGTTDLTHVVTSSVEDCFSACAENGACRGAGWGSYEGQNVCWMKSELGSPQDAGDWFFGIRQ
ncbi:Uu.00g036930.m01.CDS01 [Anthostomella pinea]|uniref:Carboxylic ester hydrolase n=1 Tax=Anthostomella pinea TaxID=933095 RepID=A0AAI8V9I2_9PEZI|nr:Uu.00g036930.m01.CDS01 [Anthostomella pinea]